jgi:signal transduction histidine kinase
VRRLTRTSSFQLTLRYAVLFGTSVLLLGAAVYLQILHFATEQQDELLEREIKTIQREVTGRSRSEIVESIGAHARHPPAPSLRYGLLNSAVDRLAGNLPPVKPRQGAFWFRGPRADKPNKIDKIRGRRRALREDLVLVVAQDRHAQEGLEELRELIARDFGYAAGATLLLALVGGMLMSAGVLRRVDAMSRSASEIVDRDLSQRLPVQGRDDEFDRLAQSVNVMLERIESQVHAMRQVSADIAHDLRTPLTRLRNRIEAAVQVDDPQHIREALERSLGDMDGVLATFSALLRIAQIEAADRSTARMEFDLTNLLLTLVEVYQPTADSKGQTLHARIELDLRATGDRDLIAQLFANLLQNAVQHSLAGARIEVRARRAADEVEVIVADNGPGIPQAEHEKVFRRLYRLERSRTTPGSGLGLALVAAIAAMHNATIALSDNAPGLRVRVALRSSQRHTQ